MIPRRLRPTVEAALDQFPVVGIVGPRQLGRTTLPMAIAADRDEVLVLDLERRSHAARLADPEFYLIMRRRGAPWVAYEAKYALDPPPARGFWTGFTDVGAKRGEVVYPGGDSWPLSDEVSVVPARSLAQPS
jgi:hypothetical protein